MGKSENHIRFFTFFEPEIWHLKGPLKTPPMEQTESAPNNSNCRSVTGSATSLASRKWLNHILVVVGLT